MSQVVPYLYDPSPTRGLLGALFLIFQISFILFSSQPFSKIITQESRGKQKKDILLFFTPT